MSEPGDLRHVRRLEAQCAAELAALLEGVPTRGEFEVEASSSFLYGLELLITAWIARRDPAWRTESLDGIFVARACKTSSRSAEFVGTCILISDQTVAPLLLNLTLTPENERLERVRIRLGEHGGGALGISGPPCNSAAAAALLASMVERAPQIAWAYDIQAF